MDAFLELLSQVDGENDLLDFCRKNLLHGTPKIFVGHEEKFYDFRKRISKKFDINFHEVYITGSAKLGFSIFKKTDFSYDSDVDVAIVSAALYEKMMDHILNYQMQLRASRTTVTHQEIKGYHKFLEYSAMGWFRPDWLPLSFQVDAIKTNWFDFFKSISYGESEVGNYKVAAGVFKSYRHFENYTFSGLQAVRRTLEIGNHNG